MTKSYGVSHRTSAALAQPQPGVIRLRVKTISQLFNSLDPSPFIEKDLDPEAEAFIVSWAREFHSNQPLCLTIHLTAPASEGDDFDSVTKAVRNYFWYRMGMADREFNHILREGRRSLLVGLCFLVTCTVAATFAYEIVGGHVGTILREGLLIGGWVAMWRPLELLLYSWWPVRRTRELHRRLSNMQVEVVVEGA